MLRLLAFLFCIPSKNNLVNEILYLLWFALPLFLCNPINCNPIKISKSILGIWIPLFAYLNLSVGIAISQWMISEYLYIYLYITYCTLLLNCYKLACNNNVHKILVQTWQSIVMFWCDSEKYNYGIFIQLTIFST